MLKGKQYILRETISGFETTRPETLEDALAECTAANNGRTLGETLWMVVELPQVQA